MTSQGNPHARFQRALATNSLHLIRATAAELPRIGVAEAAAMLLAVQRIEPETYPRAAVRWLAKLCADTRAQVGLADLARAASALELLPERPEPARAALRSVCEGLGLIDAARVFAR